MVRKSLRDSRTYAALQLENGLKAVVMTDSKASVQAGCSLTVGVGDFSDPLDYPGLAHFAEHMCFMGTQKYPDENSFSQFVSQHGGYTNAYTTLECTTYLFEVDADVLPEALDRFAQFFIAPLFSDNAVEREIKSIDSEFSLNLQNDAARKELLLMYTLNAPHPLRRFHWGSAKSLSGPDLPGALAAFHSAYYSSNLMTLAVYGANHKLSDLQQWVNTCFGPIPNKAIERPSIALCSIPDIAHHDHYFKIASVKTKKELEITWMLPCIYPYYKSQPDKYLVSLLGHESRGSLLCALKDAGLATSLLADLCSETTSNYTPLSLAIRLTDTGFTRWWDVINMVFAYINMIKAQGVSMTFYHELRRIKELEFEFIEKSESAEYCSTLSSNLQEIPEEDVVTVAHGLVEIESADDVAMFLGYLTWEGCRVDLTAPGFEEELDLQEEWFGTKYARVPFPPECCWTPVPGLSLPEPNPFLPESLALLACADAVPAKVWESKLQEVWFSADTGFQVCRACAYLLLRLPDFRNSPARYVASDLMAMVIKNDLSDEFGYLADMAGFEIEIKALDSALEVRLAGFSEKLPALVERVLAFLYNFTPKLQTINMLMERLAEKYMNADLDPLSQCRHSRCAVLLHEEYLSEVKLAALRRLSSEGFEYSLAEVHVLSFFMGNLEVSTVQDVAEYTEGLLHAAEVKRIRQIAPRTLLLLKDDEKLAWDVQSHNPNNANSVLEVFCQFAQASLEERTLADLLEQVLEEDVFNVLRTEQQLGYLVEATSRVLRGVSGLLIRICSSDFAPGLLQERLEAFLAQTIQGLGKEFQTHKKSLISNKSEPFHNLQDKADFYWNEIVQGNLEFTRKEKEIKVLRGLKLKAFKQWLTARHFPERALVVRVHAQKWPAPEDQLSARLREDPEGFRKEFPCYSWMRLI